MANKIEIINKALKLIGMKRITSLDDNSPQAQAANATYNITLESVLSSGVFSFSLERVVFAALSETPAFIEDEMDLVYQKPTGCLRLVDFSPKNAKAKLEGDKIYSDTASLAGRIVVRVEDTSFYFPAFVEAFSMKLAADMSYSLTNGTTQGEKLLTAYENIYLPRAKSADSTQGDAPEIDVSTIEYAKYGVE
jgi:hypothetical protein